MYLMIRFVAIRSVLKKVVLKKVKEGNMVEEDTKECFSQDDTLLEILWDFLS